MLELSGFLGLVIFVLDVWAIIKTWKSKSDDLKKAIWTGVIFFLPVLGLIIWFLFGPDSDS